MDGLAKVASFRRGNRSRTERYPALLTGHEETPIDNKTEKMYSFGTAEFLEGLGHCPIGLADYNATSASYMILAAKNNSESPFADGERRRLCIESGSVTRLAMMENGYAGGLTTYARIRPCPQCVRRRCQCTVPSGRQCVNGRDSKDVRHSESSCDEELGFFDPGTPPSSTVEAAARACVVSLLEWEDDDGDAAAPPPMQHSSTLNPDHLPDLHPLSSPGCVASSDAGSRDPIDDDDDDVESHGNEVDVAKQLIVVTG